MMRPQFDAPFRPFAGLRSRVVLAALALFISLCCGARAQSEATVKAAYLLNFAKLVEWPAAAFAGGDSLIIGVVGRDAVGDELARANASANGRRIEVRRISAGEAAQCHLVFAPAGSESVIGAVAGKPVLTVGDGEGFARRGGALGFVKEGGTVKFEANPKAAARNGLTVSSKLLRVARGVIDK
jgi:hypothetical protein